MDTTPIFQDWVSRLGPGAQRVLVRTFLQHQWSDGDLSDQVMGALGATLFRGEWTEGNAWVSVRPIDDLLTTFDAYLGRWRDRGAVEVAAVMNAAQILGFYADGRDDDIGWTTGEGPKGVQGAWRLLYLGLASRMGIRPENRDDLVRRLEGVPEAGPGGAGPMPKGMGVSPARDWLRGLLDQEADQAQAVNRVDRTRAGDSQRQYVPDPPAPGYVPPADLTRARAFPDVPAGPTPDEREARHNQAVRDRVEPDHYAPDVDQAISDKIQEIGRDLPGVGVWGYQDPAKPWPDGPPGPYRDPNREAGPGRLVTFDTDDDRDAQDETGRAHG